eukprot:TRINITY_DN35522_c0_g1_i2.p1 TRINITY_DN35522_c0_g1~~TRINITY_DN35522_c0_g1_i2.p1  ORF type:complete len:569 (+),score=91.01 TRINITY_DN35522_c0_g1_i2:71-1708(+)
MPSASQEDVASRRKLSQRGSESGRRKDNAPVRSSYWQTGGAASSSGDAALGDATATRSTERRPSQAEEFLAPIDAEITSPAEYFAAQRSSRASMSSRASLRRSASARRSRDDGTLHGDAGVAGANNQKGGSSSSAARASSATPPSGGEPANLMRGVASRSNRSNCVEMVPAIGVRMFGNIAGFAGLGIGYGFAKLEGVLLGTEMADCKSFQLACNGMLSANGIVPTAIYERSETDVAPLPTDEAELAAILRNEPIMVSNHVTYLDVMVLPVVLNMPKFVSKSEVLSWPLFGRLGKDLDYIWVDRTSKDSRESTVQAIAGHASKWKKGDRPLVLFPEGTTSSGRDLLEFKKGAFVSGKPVRPVVLKYTGAWDPANTDYREAESDTDTEHTQAPGDKRIVHYKEGDWAAQFVGHLTHSCIVFVLRPYVPNAEERANPELYAANVRAVMLKRVQELGRVFSRRGDSGARAAERIMDYRRRRAMRKQVKREKSGAVERTKSSGAGSAMEASPSRASRRERANNSQAQRIGYLEERSPSPPPSRAAAPAP